MSGILFDNKIKVNDAISIHIPSVLDVWKREDDFFSAVTSIISTPYDMMVQLDDMNIDFTKIDEFELFCMLFGGLKESGGDMLFGDLDLSAFRVAFNKNTNEMVLWDQDRDIVIDKALHSEISGIVRKIVQIPKEVKKPGNEEGKKYMIRIARMNQKRQARLLKNKDTTQLEDIIISLVNTQEFPYDFESVKGITIYQLYLSLNQVAHRINYGNVMHGYYAGTVKMEDIKQSDRTWVKS